MFEFVDFRGYSIFATIEALDHIKVDHPEITVAQIQTCLVEPSEVRKSKFNSATSRCEAQLYYRLKLKSENRFVIVVVKFCPDGNFLKTAYTGETVKSGEVIFKRKES